MPTPLYWIDAFTDRPFAGNPAAVCVLEAPAPERWMQAVATEIGLSETAFLVPRPDGFGLRWFTPATEVDLCGHATLASAHALWHSGRLAEGATARFHTRSGVLTAEQDGTLIALDFPATPPEPASAPPGLLEALGVSPVSVERSTFDYLVEVGSAEEVRSLRPDLAALAAVETRGVIVTAASDGDSADFVSRFFAPAAGVDEDPVTGSAHCALAPFWAERFGRRQLTGYQASARGGTVHVGLEGDRIRLSGHAVTVLEGSLASDPA